MESRRSPGSYRLSLPTAERDALPGENYPLERDMRLYEASFSDDSGSSSDYSSSESSSDDSSSGSSSDDSSSGSSSDTSDTDDRRDYSDDEIDTLLHSIDPSRVTHAQPEPMDESSLMDANPDVSMTTPDDTPEYTIVKASSQRQKDKLVDKSGFSYSVKRKRGPTTYWHCSVRNKTTNCKATVIQRNDVFTTGMHPHIHLAEVGTANVLKVKAAVKTKAAADHFKSAAVIVEEILTEELQHEGASARTSIS